MSEITSNNAAQAEMTLQGTRQDAPQNLEAKQGDAILSVPTSSDVNTDTHPTPPKVTPPPPHTVLAEPWLIAAMLTRTFGCGLVDAVAYLALGRVFVANMTGNVLFLGFSVNKSSGLSPAPQAVALGGFVIGAAVSGRLGRALGSRTRRWLVIAIGSEVFVLTLVAVLMGVGVIGPDFPLPAIALLALTMGLHGATTRRISAADLMTNVLTMAITGLAADSFLGGGSDARPLRRLGSVAAMLLGALFGSLLLEVSVAGTVGLSAGMALIVLLIFAFAPGPP
jgi:uncharacterized membrane protein YoaK (UPF0700 family)